MPPTETSDCQPPREGGIGCSVWLGRIFGDLKIDIDNQDVMRETTTMQTIYRHITEDVADYLTSKAEYEACLPTGTLDAAMLCEWRRNREARMASMEKMDESAWQLAFAAYERLGVSLPVEDKLTYEAILRHGTRHVADIRKLADLAAAKEWE